MEVIQVPYRKKQTWKFRFSFWRAQNGSTPAGGRRTIYRAREGNESKVNYSDDRVIKLSLVAKNNFWAIPPNLFDIFNNFRSFLQYKFVRSGVNSEVVNRLLSFVSRIFLKFSLCSKWQVHGKERNPFGTPSMNSSFKANCN